MGLGPGSERFPAYEQGSGNFGLAATLRREFKDALAIGGVVKRWAAAMARRQDFEIGAHGTSQDVMGKFAGERSALPERIPEVQAVRLAHLHAFLRLYGFIGEVTVRSQARLLPRIVQTVGLTKNILNKFELAWARRARFLRQRCLEDADEEVEQAARYHHSHRKREHPCHDGYVSPVTR